MFKMEIDQLQAQFCTVAYLIDRGREALLIIFKTVVQFCNHLYDYRLNRTPLSPLTCINLLGERVTADISSIMLSSEQRSLEKLDLFHSMEVFFPEYFRTIPRIIPYHGKHSMELDKTMETGFSNQYFQNGKSKMEIFPKFPILPILPCYGRGPIFESTQRACILKYVLLH